MSHNVKWATVFSRLLNFVFKCIHCFVDNYTPTLQKFYLCLSVGPSVSPLIQQSVNPYAPWTFFVASFSGPTLHGYLKFDFRVEFIGLPYDTFTHYPTISYILNTYTPLDTWIANLKMFVIFFAETSIQGFLKFVSRFIIVSYITFLDSSINNFLLTKIFGCGYHQSADASSFTCCYLNYHTCWLI